MIPYSEREQKTLVERLCNEIFSTVGKYTGKDNNEVEEQRMVLPPLQLLFDLEFEQRFAALIQSIYRRLPAL